LGNNANVSVNQQKQYGDRKAMEEFESGMKPAPMSGGMVPDRKPGRPTTGGAPAQKEEPIPEEHVRLANEMAEWDDAEDFWARLLSRFPNNPYGKMMHRNARTEFERLAMRFYNETPNGA
jgi:hypothetical protein